LGKVVMYASVSVDGFIADENDQPGPLFDWLLSGDVPLDESGALKVSRVWSTRCAWTSSLSCSGLAERYFGSVHAQHLLEDPDVVMQGNRVLHLRYRVRR
jgi:hypothetical protein